MWLSTFLSLIRTLLFGWIWSLRDLLRALWGLFRVRLGKDSDTPKPINCFPIIHPAFVRPDPLLYSQRSLMAQGLAVTWDNPDIQLFENGVPVSSAQLETSTTYDVQIRVWNNSLEAPVVQMPVHLSFLDFGIGTEPIPVGSTIVDVGVKGSPSQPGFATIPWTTPATPGHFCLQALLDPADDLDFTNNLGQENTDVAQATSPADFSFTLRNNTQRTRSYRFELDSYVIPDLLPCSFVEGSKSDLLDRHRRKDHPVPLGFVTTIDPESPTLTPNESVVVKVSVTPPAGFAGEQSVNVNVFYELGFAGGVSLTVSKGV
jgi:hypothetical protein